jgi:hypothetical protein
LNTVAEEGLSLLSSADICELLVVPEQAQLLRWSEAGWYSSQPLLPPCPRFLLHLGPRGSKKEYPMTT